MCGIVAYIGRKEAYPILINGLKRLEYRGYDSAGVAIIQHHGIALYKRRGKVSDLEDYCMNKDMSAHVGIAHTRWATHGEPNNENAHPHLSENGKLALIHNGIVENYVVLKQELMRRGYTFRSNTDTEVLVHLIEDIYKNEQVDLAEAVRLALSGVVGTYALAVLSAENPDRLIVAKRGSPLLIGVGDNEYFIGSDGAPIVEYTKQVIYLKDGEVAVVSSKQEIVIKNS
jgi:glucosamine--fructose-6-phosphate aminotransferase (isomerizing)